MNKIKKGLGRGLSSLIGETKKYTSNKIAINQLIPNRYQPRKFFDEENLDLIFEKKTRPTIKGITLFDTIVIRNWLAFAKIIGDDSYKLISNREFYSKFIEEKIKAKVLQKQKLILKQFY